MTAYTSFQVGGSTGTPNAFNTFPFGVSKSQFNIANFVSVNGFVSGDTEQLLVIPAGSRLILHAVRNDSALALGGTPVFSLGDSSSATQWVNASTNVAINVSHTLANTSKTYDTADILKLTLSNSTGTVTSGTFTITYTLLDVTANPVAQASVQV